MTGITIDVKSQLVVQNFGFGLAFFVFVSRARIFFAFRLVSFLKMARPAAFDVRRSGFFQRFGCQHDVAFGSDERRFQSRFRLIRVMTFSTADVRFSVRTVFVKAVRIVVKGDFAVFGRAVFI